MYVFTLKVKKQINMTQAMRNNSPKHGVFELFSKTSRVRSCRYTNTALPCTKRGRYLWNGDNGVFVLGLKDKIVRILTLSMSLHSSSLSLQS